MHAEAAFFSYLVLLPCCFFRAGQVVLQQSARDPDCGSLFLSTPSLELKADATSFNHKDMANNNFLPVIPA